MREHLRGRLPCSIKNSQKQNPRPGSRRGRASTPYTAPLIASRAAEAITGEVVVIVGNIVPFRCRLRECAGVTHDGQRIDLRSGRRAYLVRRSYENECLPRRVR
jgi:hypothetical protein